MQAFKERQIKPYRYRNCPKSFKSSKALKYHLDKVHSNEAQRTGEMEGKLRIIFKQFPLYITSLCLVRATSDVFSNKNSLLDKLLLFYTRKQIAV